MPLSRRQFELRVDEQGEEWMRQIYELLVRDRELAYSAQELTESILGANVSVSDSEKFQRSLDALDGIQAVEKRWVDDLDYYAFFREFDTGTWERDYSDSRF